MKKVILNLGDLLPGESAVVKSLSTSASMRRRLMDLGFAPGSELNCVGIAPFGDPKAFYIKGTLIALRIEDSSTITVEKQEQGTL